MRKLGVLCALGAYVLQSGIAFAATKDFALQGYALPAEKPVTVVLMRPDVQVGELQAGGLPQPNAEWTEGARAQITKALRTELQSRKLDFVVMDDRVPVYLDTVTARARDACRERRAVVAASPAASPAVGLAAVAQAQDCDNLAIDPPIDAAALVADYHGLHEAVTQAILAHKYGLGAGKLPTKKEAFDYTLGPGTAPLGEVSGANYGLFVATNDQFASDSRKAMQVMGALGCIIGACVIVGGGIHVGYVSLVDLQTGNIVWFNLLRGSKGDVREEEGARGMVAAIMAGMPTRPGQQTEPTAAASK